MFRLLVLICNYNFTICLLVSFSSFISLSKGTQDNNVKNCVKGFFLCNFNYIDWWWAWIYCGVDLFIFNYPLKCGCYFFIKKIEILTFFVICSVIIGGGIWWKFLYQILLKIDFLIFWNKLEELWKLSCFILIIKFH